MINIPTSILCRLGARSAISRSFGTSVITKDSCEMLEKKSLKTESCRLKYADPARAKDTQKSIIRISEAKTPIQKFGWEYLVKQRGMKRPIAPHLTIYQPQLTWMLSGFHRISGCVMAGTLLVGGLGFAVLPLDFTTFVEYIRGWNLPCAVTAVFKYIIAFPIIFHTLNGIRFLGFDLAKGVDNIGQVYKSGWLVFGVSAVIALAIVINSCQNKSKAVKTA
ncbi:hypothetical protein B9Z55_009558 [Caenorhabditis nigoni]|uniref:Succinate dehydrogenase cytochrome b560 subunit, mitochondrial n=1 Tax=Caenorhabditis nigoni TaxID=1611254 RepID=A0A2G5UT00_9PELO|nr:hypothetical protein B9Z55_009558 [Caenorhabditis nigoni]